MSLTAQPLVFTNSINSFADSSLLIIGLDDNTTGKTTAVKLGEELHMMKENPAAVGPWGAHNHAEVKHLCFPARGAPLPQMSRAENGSFGLKKKWKPFIFSNLPAPALSSWVCSVCILPGRYKAGIPQALPVCQQQPLYQELCSAAAASVNNSKK